MPLNQDRKIRRNLLTSLVFLIGVGFSLASYSAVKNYTRGDERFKFQQATANRVLAIQREIDADLATLRALASLYQTFPKVSGVEFYEFTEPTVDDPTIASLEWIPRVESGTRDTFVELTRLDIPDFEIHDRAGNRVEGQEYYFPILYQASHGGQPGLGLDLASDEATKKILEEANRTGQAVATSRVRLGSQEGYGFIVYVPILEDKALSGHTLRGFIRGVFDIDALVSESLKYLEQADLNITLLDLLASDPSEQLLYTNKRGNNTVHDNDFKIVENLRLAGRTWKMVVEPTGLDRSDAWQSWAVLGFGILVSLLFAAYMRSLMGRTSEVEQLVDQRTAELAEQVSERQEALRRLRRSEEQYRDLFEQSQALIWTHDENGLIRTINPAAACSLGYTPPEMVGENLRSFIIPTERHRFQEYLDGVKSAESDRGLLKLYTKNGATRFWLYHNSRCRDDEEGAFIRCHALDVTENQQAERELERLSRKNQLILDSAGEGIYGINLAGECTFANPAAQKYTGHSIEELLRAEHTMHEILLHTQAGGKSYPWEESPAYQTLQDGKIRRVTDEIMWNKEGGHFPVDYVVTPIVEEDDRILGAVVTFQDVTERKEIEQMKNEFISIVSHELRTPLTSIRGSLGLLASGMLKKFPDKAEGMLKIAVENTDRLVRLINDILDIERLESGKVTIEKVECDLGDLMKQAHDTMEAMANDNQVKLELSPHEGTVLADSDRILQVLTNLLSNAIKFSPEDGVVELFTEYEDDTILVKVRDHGRGIPDDKQEKIFERFGQVDSSDAREKGGTGLGLPICKTIITQHGGDLWVESKLGEGSTFIFTLPTEQSQQDSEEAA